MVSDYSNFCEDKQVLGYKLNSPMQEQDTFLPLGGAVVTRKEKAFSFVFACVWYALVLFLFTRPQSTGRKYRATKRA